MSWAICLWDAHGGASQLEYQVPLHTAGQKLTPATMLCRGNGYVGKIAIPKEDIMSVDCVDYYPYHDSMPIL